MKNVVLAIIIIIFGFIVSCVLTESNRNIEEEPHMEMHRVQDSSTMDESGWYYAKSTNGNFSIYMPIPFNDFTITTDSTQIYNIGSTSFEGIVFSVVQAENLKDEPFDLKELVSNLNQTSRPVSNVEYYDLDNYTAVNFDQKSINSNAFMKYAVHGGNLYMMIIEYPIEQEELVLEIKDGFFDSLQIED